MSHFTHMKTRFQNLFYLEKALNRLNILHKEKEKNTNDLSSNNINLLIPQSNGYDIEFAWNGKEYELIVDMSFWEQPYPIESFIDKVAQQYAGEVIIGESKKSRNQYAFHHHLRTWHKGNCTGVHKKRSLLLYSKTV